MDAENEQHLGLCAVASVGTHERRQEARAGRGVVAVILVQAVKDNHVIIASGHRGGHFPLRQGRRIIHAGIPLNAARSKTPAALRLFGQ